jgi:adenylate cyclase
MKNIEFTKLKISILAILLAIFLFLIYINAFSNIRPDLTDKLYGNQDALDNIVIIEIDDESINKIGRWPWNRDVFAELLIKLKGAKTIGLDVSFFEQSNKDLKLSDTIASSNNIVLASEVIDKIIYKPIFQSKHGHVNLITDDDGIVRSLNPNLLESELPFSFEIYKQSWNPDAKFKSEPYLINFIGPPGTFKTFSANEVLSSNIPFQNKIVLIGATAPNLHDNFFVPTSEGKAMPGVEIHATILQNLILDNFLKKQSNTNIFLIVLLTSLLGMFLISRLKIYYLIPVSILMLILYSFLAIFLFNRFDYILDLFFAPLSLIIFTSTGVGINYLEERKHTNFLKNAFGKYINKELLSQIIKKENELRLGGTKRTITIFFSDIRGFTSLCEKLDPDKLAHLLNTYLTKMTKIILENKGTLDKFIGDAIMAFWNAPLIEKRHAILACKTAKEQIAELKILQGKLKKQKLPELSIGIGIHTGEAIIGNMGSEERFDYTAIGDSVNISSRLEDLTKLYKLNIILSEDTYNLVKKEFQCRKVDIVKLKGKKIPINIYELSSYKNKKFIEKYEKALYFYFDSKFKQALNEFKSALKLKKNDQPTKIFIERCKKLIKHAPSKGRTSIKIKTD